MTWTDEDRKNIASLLEARGFKASPEDGVMTSTPDGVYFTLSSGSTVKIDPVAAYPGVTEFHPHDIQLTVVGALPKTPLELSQVFSPDGPLYWVKSFAAMPMDLLRPGVRQIAIERGIWSILLRRWDDEERPA